MPDNVSQIPNRNVSLPDLTRLRVVVWGVATFFGFLKIWPARFCLSPDADYYLDIAHAYLRRDWPTAINAYWSPLFSWILAICLSVTANHPYWDSTVVHAVNFVALLVSLRCFEFLLAEFLQVHGRADDREDSQSHATYIRATWALGCGLFLSSALLLMPARVTTPDVLVACVTYLAAGIVLRLYQNGSALVTFLMLGAALGTGYLAKAFYFPMSALFFLAAFFVLPAAKRNSRHLIGGLAVFALIAGPWIFVISRAKRHFTIGEVGKISVAMTMDRLLQPAFWQGEGGIGSPKHPVRQLSVAPRIYEYDGPLRGAYPPWFDISYWMDGVRPRFYLRGLLQVLRQSAGTFFQIWSTLIEFFALLLFLFFLNRRQLSFYRPAVLGVIAAFACLAYSIILVENRYVTSFLVLLWLSAFFLITKQSPRSRRVYSAMVLATLTIAGVRLMKYAVDDAVLALSHPRHIDWDTAQALNHRFLPDGGKIAVIGDVGEADWARLANIRIVAEIPLGDEMQFWTATSETQKTLLLKLGSTAASFVVTKNPPFTAASSGWQPLDPSGFYIHSVPPER